MSTPFDLDRLVGELRTAAAGERPQHAVKAVLEAAVADPGAVAAGMPDFADNDVVLHEDAAVSIWHCRFMPGQTVPAHDHQMLATIGLYKGAERNDFFAADPATGGLRKSSEVLLSPGDVLQIGPSAIHAVACASPEPCEGIHVYLGALTEVHRSLFDVETGEAIAFTDENYERMARAE